MKIKQIFSGQMPKGKYFIGDLSYIMPDEIYEEYVVSSLSNNTIVKIKTDNGEEFLACFGTTFVGDGLFNDNRGNEYGVDAGIIGVMQLFNEEIVSKAEELMDEGLAQIIDFDSEFEVSIEAGIFYFGHIVIDTTGEDEEDQWNEEGYENEEVWDEE